MVEASADMDTVTTSGPGYDMAQNPAYGSHTAEQEPLEYEVVIPNSGVTTKL